MDTLRHRGGGRRPGLPSHRPSGARAGFVLAEGLVSFAVLAAGLGLIVAGMAVALRSDGRATSARAALREAQGVLARAGLTDPLAGSDLHGGDPGGTRWRMRVTPARPQFAGSRVKEGTAPPPPVAAFWVEVTVAMPDGVEASLAGLKLAPTR